MMLHALFQLDYDDISRAEIVIILPSSPCAVWPRDFDNSMTCQKLVRFSRTCANAAQMEVILRIHDKETSRFKALGRCNDDRSHFLLRLLLRYKNHKSASDDISKPFQAGLFP